MYVRDLCATLSSNNFYNIILIIGIAFNLIYLIKLSKTEQEFITQYYEGSIFWYNDLYSYEQY